VSLQNNVHLFLISSSILCLSFIKSFLFFVLCTRFNNASFFYYQNHLFSLDLFYHSHAYSGYLAVHRDPYVPVQAFLETCCPLGHPYPQGHQSYLVPLGALLGLVALGNVLLVVVLEVLGLDAAGGSNKNIKSNCSKLFKAGRHLPIA
jgi:hypothetical protein